MTDTTIDSSKFEEEKEQTIPESVFKRRWKILAALCGSLLLVSIGNTSLNLALPQMAEDLQLTNLQLTWIVDAYPLVFASFLFPASAIADRYSRKNVMQIGIVIFVLATIYAAYGASSGGEVIIARAVMGFGAAMVMPTTLSIIENVFDRKERPKAIAIWTGIAGGGMAFGSIISGFLIEHYSWEAIFYFSALIGITGFIFNQIIVPDSKDEKQTPIDWVGGVLSAIGLGGLVYGIIEAPSHGLADPAVLAALLIGTTSLAIFVFHQLKSNHPMLDMKVFKIPAFSISALSITLAFFALMGIFFSISQLFQLIMGYGALESSVRMLPIMMIMMFMSPFVPNIVKKIGARMTVSSGLVLVSAGFFLMVLWPTIPSYAQVMGAMAVMMVGMSLTMTPATNMMMSAIPRNRAGMGSAMNDTTRELGGCIGIAVLGSMLSSGYETNISSSVQGLPVEVKEVAGNSLAGALFAAKDLGAAGQELAMSAMQSWMDALGSAMIVAGIIVAVAAVIAGIFLPKHNKDADDENLIPIQLDEKIKS